MKSEHGEKKYKKEIGKVNVYRFGLNENCFLVKGAKRGTIYDLKSGDVYSIDEIAKKILEKCEQGLSLREIATSIGELSTEELLEYLIRLQKLKLGRFLKEEEVVEKISLEQPTPRLNFVWLEITKRCNLRCLHCYAESGGNKTKKNKNGVLTLERWKRIIQEAYQLGCRKIQFIGGEPLLFEKSLFSLLKLTKELGYEIIEVFTNGTLISDEDVELFLRYGVRIAVSIYSKRAGIHDKITQRQGSFRKTIQNVKRLQKKGIQVRFATIVMKQNEDYLAETLGFLEKMGETQILKCFDLVRPIGRGVSSGIIPEKMKPWQYRKKPIFPKTSREEFAQRKNCHSCWWGSMAVTDNGTVLPCIMARKQAVGNILESSLKSIIQGKKLQRLWRLSKDYIEKCKDCEYRYLCVDCRPIIMGGCRNLYAPDNNCLYDPYTGKWKKISKGGEKDVKG